MYIYIYVCRIYIDNSMPFFFISWTSPATLRHVSFSGTSTLQVPSCEVLADFYEKASFVGNRTFFWEHVFFFSAALWTPGMKDFLSSVPNVQGFWDLNLPLQIMCCHWSQDNWKGVATQAVSCFLTALGWISNTFFDWLAAWNPMDHHHQNIHRFFFHGSEKGHQHPLAIFSFFF